MRTDNAPSNPPAAADRAGPRSRTYPKRLLRLVGDLTLVAFPAVLVILFLSHNGFIGNGEIQPYPY